MNRRKNDTAGFPQTLAVEDWFTIDSIVADLRLATLVRRERLLKGYFF